MNLKGWGGVILSAVLLTGCATGRNYQTDIDSLNARINALQGQLAAKDQEIFTLQGQVNDERLAHEAAETALRNAENQKRALEGVQAKKSATVSDFK